MAGIPDDSLAALKNAITACDLATVEKISARLVESIAAQGPGDPEEIAAALDEAVAAGDSDRIRRLTGEFSQQLRSHPASYPKAFVAVLREAVDSFERQRVSELCAELAGHLRTRPEVYPFEEAKQILDLLRRKRYFGPMIEVADVLIQTGQNSAGIRHQYCQALLDSGQLVAGLEMLRALERDCLKSGEKGELAEARGLIGRALKQMYMDAAGSGSPQPRLCSHLDGAIKAYHRVYRKQKPKIWHGINTVACVKRAEADGVGLSGRRIDADRIALDLLRAIAAKDSVAKKKKDPKLAANLWDMATAAEACVAAGDFEAALPWIVRYTGETAADAFEIASTLRQFEQVWRLDGSQPNQAKILQLLRAALLERDGGSVRIDDPQAEAAAAAELARDEDYEAVLGADRYKTYKWYATGLDRATGVAQIRDKAGIGRGTGFLLRGSEVHDSLAGQWLLVTNAHVISNDPTEQAGEPAALPPDEAVIVFEVGPDAGRELEVGRIVFTSPRRKLDCTIVTLLGGVSFDKPFDIARRLPLLDRNQRVYVVGHPRGGRLSFSIDDNLLLDHEVPRIHYRAPTEGGSSGSPVFNQAWQLIALHHAGGNEMRKLHDRPGTYPANEGVTISSILRAAAHELG